MKNLLSRNIEKAINKSHLEKSLLSGKKLRVKHGIDPTGEKIHLGRAVSLWKLREFQDLGHKIVLIIGDFTAQIGDPSDKLEKRPFLTKVQVEKNLKNYLPQIGKIINLKKTEVRYNSEWLGKLKFREISELADVFSVQQMIRRRNFSERWKKNQEISLRELTYPLMQGYDSVAVKADVEIGGSDQLFNLLAGRKIQEKYGQKPQDIMTTKMLLGLDGRKMSTSWGNVVNVSDKPDEQFGKIMSMRDDMIIDYMELATDMPHDNIVRYRQSMSKSKTNPMMAKFDAAFGVVERYYGRDKAKQASLRWDIIFSKNKAADTKLPFLRISSKKTTALDLVLASGIAKSKSEARRLIEQGGLEINGFKEKDPNKILNLSGGEILKVGKKQFFRVKI